MIFIFIFAGTSSTIIKVSALCTKVPGSILIDIKNISSFFFCVFFLYFVLKYLLHLRYVSLKKNFCSI